MTSFCCPACGATKLIGVAELGRMPIYCGVHWASRAEALASPVGTMSLAHCPDCGYVRNVAFDPTALVYDPTMDTNLHHSPAFQSFSGKLAHWLSQRYPLRDSLVLDIGCGQGEFLRELCQVAGCRGVGYDAMYAGESPTATGHPVPDPTATGHTMPDPTTNGHSTGGVVLHSRHAPLDETTPPFDFVTSRHWLEHLDDPYGFLVRLRELAGNRPVRGYLEVPDAGYDLATAGWEVIYPHVSYFDGYSLCRLVRRAGWRLLATGRLFAGMFRFVEICVNTSDRPDPLGPSGLADRDRHLASITGFAQRHAAERDRWRSTVDRLADRGDQPVLWGAGSRGVQFLHLADPGRRLAAVVDVNPRKWDRYLPVTGHRVQPPEALTRLAPRTVIITNPAYRAEIGRSLRLLGIRAELLVA